MTEWISVNDQLPEDNKKVWVIAKIQDPHEMFISKCNWQFVGHFVRETGWSVAFNPEKKNIVTHWMPLPEPPK